MNDYQLGIASDYKWQPKTDEDGNVLCTVCNHPVKAHGDTCLAKLENGQVCGCTEFEVPF